MQKSIVEARKLLREKKWTECLRVCGAAVKKFPDAAKQNTHLILLVGIASYQKGDFVQSERALKKGLELARMGAKTEIINKVTLQTILIEETFPGFGFYPKPGKCIGFLHDDIQERKKLTNVVSVGIMNSAATIRATDEANFSVHDLISYIKKNLPESFVSGGGHKNAGAITFLPNKKEKVMIFLRKYIESIK